MKYLLILLLFGINQAAPAKDFRALNFGESCENIDDYELRNSSRILIGRPSNSYKSSEYYDNGERYFFSYRAIIRYVCDDEGLFEKGVVSFRADSRSALGGRFGIKFGLNRLIQIYGPPQFYELPDDKYHVPVSFVGVNEKKALVYEAADNLNDLPISFIWLVKEKNLVTFTRIDRTRFRFEIKRNDGQLLTEFKDISDYERLATYFHKPIFRDCWFGQLRIIH